MKLLYSLGWVLSRGLGTALFRCRYHNPDNVPSSGPAILASNHASFLDPPLVGAGLTRPIHCLARESLFRLPGFGTVLPRINVVPVDRDGGGAAGLRAILDRLLLGGAILVFPEGTRTPDGHLHPARSGIGLTVIKSTAPVIPVRIFGSFEAWGRNRRLPRPHPISIKYGPPLTFHTLRTEARNCPKPRLKSIYQEIAVQIMDAIRHLQPYTDRRRFP